MHDFCGIAIQGYHRHGHAKRQLNEIQAKRLATNLPPSPDVANLITANGQLEAHWKLILLGCGIDVDAALPGATLSGAHTGVIPGGGVHQVYINFNLPIGTSSIQQQIVTQYHGYPISGVGLANTMLEATYQTIKLQLTSAPANTPVILNLLAHGSFHDNNDPQFWPPAFGGRGFAIGEGGIGADPVFTSIFSRLATELDQGAIQSWPRQIVLGFGGCATERWDAAINAAGQLHGVQGVFTTTATTNPGPTEWTASDEEGLGKKYPRTEDHLILYMPTFAAAPVTPTPTGMYGVGAPYYDPAEFGGTVFGMRRYDLGELGTCNPTSFYEKLQLKR